MNAAKNNQGGEPDLGALRQVGQERIKPRRPFVSVGMGTCGIGNGADAVYAALGAAAAGADVAVRRVGCFGFCAAEPLVMAYRPGKPLLLFTEAKSSRAPKFVAALADDASFDKLAKSAVAKIEAWDFRTSSVEFGKGYDF
ncbi:MAG: (2Fe-2S) ferredoxin domain-containing protein, partial [Rectinemataceae bacterium]